MHIGMIVGIGPAATDYYYRHLISTMAREGRELELTMAHADTPTLLRNQEENNQAAQVAIYLKLAARLKLSGVQAIAVTSIAGHFCIDAFKAVSPLPVIDLLATVKSEVKRLGFKTVGLLGTRVVMESRLYGVLDGVEVCPPTQNLLEVHEAYVAMASVGIATDEHREVFTRNGKALAHQFGCESILLAGTDLALVFNKNVDPGFKIFDCAEAHALAISQWAMR